MKAFDKKMISTWIATARAALLMTCASALADQAPAVPADVSVAQAPVAATASAPTAQQPGNLLGTLAPLLLMFGLFYFMIIMPQNKRMKEQKQMQSELKVGDDVLLNSGFLGKVVGVDENVFTVEFEAGARAKVVKNAIVKKGKNLHETTTGKA